MGERRENKIEIGGRAFPSLSGPQAAHLWNTVGLGILQPQEYPRQPANSNSGKERGQRTNGGGIPGFAVPQRTPPTTETRVESALGLTKKQI